MAGFELVSECHAFFVYHVCVDLARVQLVFVSVNALLLALCLIREPVFYLQGIAARCLSKSQSANPRSLTRAFALPIVKTYLVALLARLFSLIGV